MLDLCIYGIQKAIQYMRVKQNHEKIENSFVLLPLFLAFCLRFRDITVNIDFNAYSYAGSESKFYVAISQQKHFF